MIELAGGSDSSDVDRLHAPANQPEGPSPPASAPTAPASLSDAAVSKALAQLQVLLVDDDPDARNLAAAMLKRVGTSFTLASSAAEAFTLFKRGCFTILLCDISMPEENGYQLIERIRRSEGERGLVPILAAALTANVSDADKRQSVASGFHLHVAKPYTYRQLFEALAHLLRQDHVGSV